MKSSLVLFALCSGCVLTAAGRMNVAICGGDPARGRMIAGARTEAAFVFRAVAVEIVWRDCSVFPPPAEQEREPWFVVRLRRGTPPRMPGPASLDLIGQAYVVPGGGGSLADVYLEAMQESVDLYEADPGMLLGFVIAHELGHLLLGAGHMPEGIMQAAWTRPEMGALRQRWLKFSPPDGDRLLNELQARCARPVAGPAPASTPDREP